MAVYSIISSQTLGSGNAQQQYCATQQLGRQTIAVNAQLTTGSAAQTSNTSGEVRLYIAGTSFSPTVMNAPAQLQYFATLDIVVPPAASVTQYVSSGPITLPGNNLYVWADYLNIPANSLPTLSVNVSELDNLGALLFSESRFTWQYTNNNTPLTGTTATAIATAAGTGLRNYLTGIQISNTSATATVLNVLDGSTVINSIHLPGTSTSLQETPYLYNFETPLRGSANTAMNVQCVTGGASVYVNAQGFVAP
jgi:hypothetical protein